MTERKKARKEDWYLNSCHKGKLWACDARTVNTAIPTLKTRSGWLIVSLGFWEEALQF
jgi:hypothetical protein